MRIFLLFLILSAPISSQAQLLSLKDLSLICSEDGWVGSNNLLISKGWSFDDSKKLPLGPTTMGYTAEVSWSLNRVGDNANGWVTAKIEDWMLGYGNEIHFEFFDALHYRILIDELTKSAILISNKIGDGELIYMYEKDKFDFTVTQAKGTYSITVTKTSRRKLFERVGIK